MTKPKVNIASLRDNKGRTQRALRRLFFRKQKPKEGSTSDSSRLGPPKIEEERARRRSGELLDTAGDPPESAGIPMRDSSTPAILSAEEATDHREMVPAEVPVQSPSTLEPLKEDLSLAAAIDFFLLDRTAAMRKKTTLDGYRSSLLNFQRYCSSMGVHLASPIGPTLLRTCLNFLREERQLQPGGAHAHYRTLSAMFWWLDHEEVMPPGWKNPMRFVSAPKMPLQRLEAVPLQDIEAMVATCTGGTFVALRDRAILLLLLDAGLRAQELCDVNVEDFDFYSGDLKIRAGKSPRSRDLHINSPAAQALRRYVHARPRSLDAALFLSRADERLTYYGLRELVIRRAQKAGLEKMPALHGFRRACALQMWRNGADLIAIQLRLGHSDLSLLLRYLPLTPEDIRGAHQRTSALAHRKWK